MAATKPSLSFVSQDENTTRSARRVLSSSAYDNDYKTKITHYNRTPSHLHLLGSDDVFLAKLGSLFGNPDQSTSLPVD